MDRIIQAISHIKSTKDHSQALLLCRSFLEENDTELLSLDSEQLKILLKHWMSLELFHNGAADILVEGLYYYLPESISCLIPDWCIEVLEARPPSSTLDEPTFPLEYLLHEWFCNDIYRLKRLLEKGYWRLVGMALEDSDIAFEEARELYEDLLSCPDDTIASGVAHSLGARGFAHSIAIERGFVKLIETTVVGSLVANCYEDCCYIIFPKRHPEEMTLQIVSELKLKLDIGATFEPPSEGSLGLVRYIPKPGKFLEVFFGSSEDLSKSWYFTCGTVVTGFADDLLGFHSLRILYPMNRTRIL